MKSFAFAVLAACASAATVSDSIPVITSAGTNTAACGLAWTATMVGSTASNGDVTANADWAQT